MPVRIISAKGSVVIPKALWQKYDLAPGTKVAFIDYGDGFSLVPLPGDPIAAMRGMFAEGPSLTAELLAERRKEVEHDVSVQARGGTK
ncbi:MAG TPA: AbrB/MazE/SpoVT family DNA-binding domain-containing protein [Anaerolineae bacterium]